MKTSLFSLALLALSNLAALGATARASGDSGVSKCGEGGITCTLAADHSLTAAYQGVSVHFLRHGAVEVTCLQAQGAVTVTMDDAVTPRCVASDGLQVMAFQQSTGTVIGAFTNRGGQSVQVIVHPDHSDDPMIVGVDGQF